MEGYWKFQGDVGSGGANFQGLWGVRKVIYLQRVQEHCLRETYQYRIFDLINQQIDELQYILVYSNDKVAKGACKMLNIDVSLLFMRASLSFCCYFFVFCNYYKIYNEM